MRNVIASASAIGCVLAMAAHDAMAEPRHCEPTVQAWWAKYLHRFEQSDGPQGVDLARSIPELGIAHVIWENGVEQILVVTEIEGYSACAVERLTIK
jgi:hypothetical protein